VAVVDLDPAAGGDAVPSLYSAYMQAWWVDPSEVAELAPTEMATLLISFRGSSVR